MRTPQATARRGDPNLLNLSIEADPRRHAVAPKTMRSSECDREHLVWLDRTFPVGKAAQHAEDTGLAPGITARPVTGA